MATSTSSRSGRSRVGYDQRHHLACRQVLRLGPSSGHQDQIVTTRADLGVSEAAGGSALALAGGEPPGGSCAPGASTPWAPTPRFPTTARLVPSPTEAEMARALSAARPELAATRGQSATIPAKVHLGGVRPDAVRLDEERMGLTTPCAWATWDAEHALARALGAHHARAEDAARSPVGEAFATPADLEVVGDELHVRLEALPAPRRSPAIAAVCAELNEAETRLSRQPAHASSTASRPLGSVERYGRRPNPAAVPPVLGLDFRRRLTDLASPPPGQQGGVGPRGGGQ